MELAHQKAVLGMRFTDEVLRRMLSTGTDDYGRNMLQMY
jgi:hypothetical protein